MSVGLEVKPTSLIWQSSLVIMVDSEEDDEEDAERCECCADVSEGVSLKVGHLSFAYRIIIAHFLGDRHMLVPLCRLSHIKDGQANDNERKKS